MAPDGSEAYVSLDFESGLVAVIDTDPHSVTWNGPLGYFEIDKFAQGTRRVAQAMAQSGAVTIIGGGETAEAVEKFGLEDRISHISTGGGASLAFLGGEDLPGISALE